MIRINLLPVKAAQKKEQLRNQVIVVVLLFGIVLAGCFVTQMSVNREIDSIKTEISRNKSEIKSLQKKIGEVNKFKALQEELKNKLDVLQKLKENKSGPVHLMDELIVALPDNLWVKAFTEKNGRITIKGTGLSEDDVADFMTNLETSSYYRDVKLKVTKQTKVGDLRLQSFELVCRAETPSAKAKK